jgi:DNA-binding response OmpR family regulator
MSSVVIVDDDRDLRDTLRMVLEEEGHVVRAAANGAEGLAVVREMVAAGAAPSLVIVDLMMPELDGWQVCSIADSDPSLAGVPFVILSASMDTRADVKWPMLRKPIDLEELLAAVTAHAR